MPDSSLLVRPDATSALRTIRAVVAAIDPDAITSVDARALLPTLTAIRKVATAGEALLLRRAGVDAPTLAAQTGDSLATARAALDTASALTPGSATDEAFRSGRLSLPQAQAIAGATLVDPTAEDRLLAMRTGGLSKLREAANRVKHAGEDDEARHGRIHAARYWRRWTDSDGARCGAYRMTPDRAAMLEAMAEPYIEAAYVQARKEGRREGHDAYAADALVTMAVAAGSGAKAPCTPGWPRGELIALVDLAALQRGRTEPGETCEIPGVGPVPASVARDVFGDATLKLVITKGVAVQTVVHTGRSANAVQRTALFVQQRGRCVTRTCDKPVQEVDHIIPYAVVRTTELPNLAGRCRPCHKEKTKTDDYERPPPD